MRHSSLIKLLTFSSFTTSNSNALMTTSPRSSIPTQPSRRDVVKAAFGGAAAAFVATPSRALDMDAFANSQLEQDTKNCNPKQDPKCKPNLSKDEALCKYGQSGEARGEACKRFKAEGGTLPSAASEGKSLGGAYAM